MIQVVIIEDEQIAADYLEKLLKGYSTEITIIKKLDSVEGAVAYLTNNTADLLFCDIHLADDISFNIFTQINITIPVIFTTAYDQYAIRAFKLNSIDYLLKPIDKVELFAAIDKYKSLTAQASLDINQLLKHFNTAEGSYQQRFLVSSGNKLKSVPIADVAYFYADQKLNFLVEKSGKTFIINHSLDKIEPLVNPEHFFRINRQFIVEFSSIISMIGYSKSRVKIELQPPTDKDTIVSVDRSPEFKIWLNK